MNTEHRKSELLAAALGYAERGWPVLPLHSIRKGVCTCHRGEKCDSPGKHPRTKHGLNDASTDAARIKAWWRRWPDANVGIRTGAVSGIIAIDIDPRHDGDASLICLQDENEMLPDALETETGGGGRHIILKHPGGTIRNWEGFRPGIDIRGDGGYIVAPPSIHKSGGEYRWTKGLVI